MKFSAVLFDRDGTVIFDRHYLSDPAGVELIPGTGEALAKLGPCPLHRLDFHGVLPPKKQEQGWLC